MTKDYYAILGITEFDSPADIKRAYHKLARKWHPDVAGNSKSAIKMFKEINEAYEVLSNNVKKEEYDRARKFYNYAQANTQKSQEKNENVKNESAKKGFTFKWEDFISGKSMQAFKQKEEKAAQKGKDIFSDIEISLSEALLGCSKTINMLQTSVCPKCHGHRFINGGICKFCHGKGETTNYKKFNVKIPAGVKDKSKIRLPKEGDTGVNGGPNGDLFLTIHISENKDLQKEGLNIIKKIWIQPFEAVLGTEKKVSTTDGNVILKIAPNTQNGQKFRLAGCGLVQNGQIGDMIVIVEIKIPTNLSEEEIKLYKNLKEFATDNFREDFNGN